MDWTHWKKLYQKITLDFGYDPEKDLESARILNSYFRKTENIPSFEILEPLIRNKIVFIYGCGPSLPVHLNLLGSLSLPLEDFTHIAADGATSALLENNVIPQIILTDLDGQISDLITANKKGSIVIIHAHGDNINLIRQNFSSFSGKVLGTTQNEPLSLVKNFGGFTDGDRCVFLAEALKSSSIVLIGFDFGSVIGRYSKPYLKEDELASENKVKKLQWARRLILELSLNSTSLIIRINNKEDKIGNLRNYDFKQLVAFLEKTDQD